MLCCGSAGKSELDAKTLLDSIRKFDNMEIGVDWKDCKLEFRPKTAEWKTNFNQMPSSGLEEIKERIRRLEDDSSKKDKEINDLEVKYWAKIAKLWVMTQVHCEIKTEINQKFKDFGVWTEVQEKEQRIEEDEDQIGETKMVHDQSFRQSQEML